MYLNEKAAWVTPELNILDVTKTLSAPGIDNSEASFVSNNPRAMERVPGHDGSLLS